MTDRSTKEQNGRHEQAPEAEPLLDPAPDGAGKKRETANPRFLFIDALRGVAAVGVLIHHQLHNTVLEPALRKILPLWFQHLCWNGAFGVEIFFVISGFVIAHSLRHFDFTMKGAGTFILRRQLRLDPPYWAAIAFAIALVSVEKVLPGLQSRNLPSAGEIAVNMAYLHNVTGVNQILGVAWTLCLEIQFYLLFILMLCAARLGGTVKRNTVPLITLILLLALSLGCLRFFEHYREHGPFEPFWSGLFLPYWYYFGAGVLCYWCLHRKVHGLVLAGFLAFFVYSWVWHGCPPDMITGWVTVTALYLVGVSGHLTDWLGWRLFQYPGRISYSLYLVHLPILSCIMRAGYKVTHENQWAAVGWFAVAFCACIAGAHVFYLLVEAPCVKVLSKWKRAKHHPSVKVEPAELAPQTIA